MPEIFVPGEPVAWERVNRGKDGRGHVPARTRNYKQLVGWTWKQTRVKPLKGSVSVRADFYIGGRDKDLDNLLKSILDGLNGVAWEDDKQVDRIIAQKHPAIRPPCAIVCVEAL